VKLYGFRRAAALGLFAAWYLLTPPFAPNDPAGTLNLNAPLSQWIRSDSTDTSAGCTEQRDNMVRMYQTSDITSLAIQFKLLLYHESICVSSDDPRLRPAGKQLARHRSK
jgi:hypothetical protein